MAEDARIRKTKEKLYQALIELLQEQPFADITPAKICERAGINRSTFYRNYRNIFQLREEIENQILSGISWSDRSYEPDLCKAELVRHLNFLKEKSATFRALSKDCFGNSLFEMTSRKVLEGALGSYARYSDALSQEEYRWECYFYVSALVGTIYEWYSSGMEEPVEDLAEFLSKKLDDRFLKCS